MMQAELYFVVVESTIAGACPINLESLHQRNSTKPRCFRFKMMLLSLVVMRYLTMYRSAAERLAFGLLQYLAHWLIYGESSNVGPCRILQEIEPPDDRAVVP